MQYKVALFGFGSVGSATADYLLQKTHNPNVVLTHIYTRSPQKVIDMGISKDLIVEDWHTIINNPEVTCIIELIGGVEFAKEVIIAALQAGKHVVTANKALLAHHAPTLFKVASDNNTCIAFEASCGGGIPIIKTITEGLTANTHSALYGVMNGTCNFILTKMTTDGLNFEKALELANSLGLTESDPSLDIDGLDAGHKIAILSSLAFKQSIDFSHIPLTGISAVHSKDVYFGAQLNYTIKLIAAAIEVNNELSIWVHPAFLEEHHPMKYVEGPFNVISIVGDEVGHTLYYGRGAGGKPTTSAIISDIYSLENTSYLPIFKEISTNNKSPQSAIPQVGIEAIITACYLRMQVKDEPGTLNKITSIFSENGISIARVLQEDEEHHNTPSQIPLGIAELIIITHHVKFSCVQTAHTQLSELEVVMDTPSLYPIIDAPTDQL